MPDLKQTRRKAKIIMGVMLGIDALAIGLLVSPLIGSSESRKQELSQLWMTLQAKTRQVEPLRGLDKKIPIAKEQINQFYMDRFPSHDSDVAEALGNLAKEYGVKIQSFKYK